MLESLFAVPMPDFDSTPPGVLTGRWSRALVWRLALASVAMLLAIVLLLPAGIFLSAPGTDLTGQFIAWRAFAADSIRAGHFPLWNPYAYGGQPFLGDFQSAELYPPNVIFLILPMARAVNFSFLLHLLILAWGMGYWGYRRGWHPLASVLAGLTVALSGPVFPHLYGGHLSNLSSLAWAPWILAWLEDAWQGPARRPLLLAAAGVCLQILGGHVQYCFYTGIAAGVNALAHSFAPPAVRRRALPMVAAAFGGAAILAAAQLLPGFASLAESVREGKLDFSFVKMFSFPIENTLTFFAPGFFGGISPDAYWGRAYLWEVSVFIGVSGVVLAARGLFDREHSRTARRDLAVAVVLFVLALGAHTPLLRLLYDYIPGFGQFRSLAKFTFPMILFITLAVGAGADALLRGRFGSRRFALAVLAAGGITVLAGIYLWLQPESIGALRNFIVNSHETYMGMPGFAVVPPVAVLGAGAGRALLAAGGLAVILGASFAGMGRRPAFRWVPLVLLPVELLAFAWGNLGLSNWSDVAPAQLQAYLAANPGDYRVLDSLHMNNGYLLGAPDVWGNDPTVLKRYAQFIAFFEDNDPDHATQYSSFKLLPRIFSIIRYRYAIVPNGKGYTITPSSGILPRVLLAPEYQVLPGRDAIFAEMAKPNFNPQQTVLLETQPATPFSATGGAPVGKVTVSDVTGDSLTIEADTPAPAILLITDLYSRDWRVRALPGSAQTHYDLLPGDYILRAIPLAAGHHHLVVEYAPPSFYWGLLVSGAAWLVWLAAWFWPASGMNEQPARAFGSWRHARA